LFHPFAFYPFSIFFICFSDLCWFFHPGPLNISNPITLPDRYQDLVSSDFFLKHLILTPLADPKSDFDCFWMMG
jgi:hypothetical protein